MHQSENYEDFLTWWRLFLGHFFIIIKMNIGLISQNLEFGVVRCVGCDRTTLGKKTCPFLKQYTNENICLFCLIFTKVFYMWINGASLGL